MNVQKAYVLEYIAGLMRLAPGLDEDSIENGTVGGRSGLSSDRKRKGPWGLGSGDEGGDGDGDGDGELVIFGGNLSHNAKCDESSDDDTAVEEEAVNPPPKKKGMDGREKSGGKSGGSNRTNRKSSLGVMKKKSK